MGVLGVYLAGKDRISKLLQSLSTLECGERIALAVHSVVQFMSLIVPGYGGIEVFSPGFMMAARLLRSSFGDAQLCVG